MKATALPSAMLEKPEPKRPAWRDRSWLQREIWCQTRSFKIPMAKLVRAVAQRGIPADEARAYLRGEIHGFKLDATVGDQCLLAIEEIVWAVAFEERQIKNTRLRPYLVPFHPGVPGRENRILGASRERFLEACILSQPRLARRALKALREERKRARDRYRRRTARRPSPGDAPRASSS